jgi:hypothetical protein
MRLTEAEFNAMLKQSHCSISGKAPKKKGRVQRRKVKIDGHEFDSRSEATIYCELKHDPEVKILELQPKFIILDGFNRGKKKFRPIAYTADFRIMEKGREIIVEVKSTGTLKANAKSYPMRKKMFLKKFPELGFREIIFNGSKRTIRDY